MIIKKVDFYEKLEHKLKHVARCFFIFFMEKNSLEVGKEYFFTKDNERLGTSTHKNNLEMENDIITYFNLFSNFSYKLTIFFFIFLT